MNNEKTFEAVEKQLKRFPIECRTNYYKNKESLKILEEEKNMFINSTGDYDNEKNIITLYSDDSALTHELFHMAFRDPSNVNEKVFQNSEWLYGNGLTMREKIETNEERYIGRGITEGFVSYLSKDNSYVFLNFFVDLLISIYGEEIILYALKNDPAGFIYDSRFYNILEFIFKLDKLYDSKISIKLISKFRCAFEEKSITQEKSKEIFELLDTIMDNFKISIIELFKLIIDEYSNCMQPKISKEAFINKLSCFFDDEKFKPAFVYDDIKYSVKDELMIVINRFKKNKVKVFK